MRVDEIIKIFENCSPLLLLLFVVGGNNVNDITMGHGRVKSRYYYYYYCVGTVIIIIIITVIVLPIATEIAVFAYL